MMRKIAISASTAALLAFFLLALISVPPVYHQVILTSRTTAYFSVFDGLLRVGWFTGTTPTQVLYETRSTDAGPLPFIGFKPLKSGISYDGMPFGTQQLLREQRTSWHALYWRSPMTIGPHIVYGTLFRMWVGTPAILLALWPIIAFCYGPFRRFRRRRRGQCVQCGYNLTGNSTGICPECGGALKSSNDPSKLQG